MQVVSRNVSLLEEHEAELLRPICVLQHNPETADLTEEITPGHAQKFLKFDIFAGILPHSSDREKD